MISSKDGWLVRLSEMAMNFEIDMIDNLIPVFVGQAPACHPD